MSAGSSPQQRTLPLPTALLLLAIAAPATAQQQPAAPAPAEPGKPTVGQIQQRSYFFAAAGKDVEYALYVARSHDPSTAAPLVVLLHGLGSNPRQVMGYQGITDAADKHGCIVVAPFGYNSRGWYGARGKGKEGPYFGAKDDPDNLGELSQQDVLNVLDLARREFRIDADRIYLMGHSMGGAGTLHLAATFPDLWAAIAPLAPAVDAGIERLRAMRHIPTKIVAADQDRLVPVQSVRRWVEEMKRLEMDHQYIEIERGDHVTSFARNAAMIGGVFDFLASKRRAAAAAGAGGMGGTTAEPGTGAEPGKDAPRERKSGAQPRDLPPPEAATVGTDGDALAYAVQLPPDFAPTRFAIVVLLLLPEGDLDTQPLVMGLARAGCVVAATRQIRPALRDLPGVLRKRFRIAHGGLHLVAVGDTNIAACELATARAVEFQSLSLFGGPPTLDPVARTRLRGRRLCVFHGDGQAPEPRAGTNDGLQEEVHADHHPGVPADRLERTLVAHVLRLHQERSLPGAANDVDQTLDDFHDAADKGDAARYFAILPDDAVFLGTDASERWTGAGFRRFAEPWFRRGSAWTYVPLRRYVEVVGDLAWFDERLDNDAYGECRGSGVLQRRDGRWVLRQYNLTIPVPNALAREFVARIRESAAGLPPATTTVVLVRHAERDPGDDPDLNEAGRRRAARLAVLLRDLPITAAFASEFRRTQQTVAPICQGRGLAPEIVKGLDTKALVQRIRAPGGVRTVLVAAHSNTIPAILQQLGIARPVEIDDDDYDDLFVVTLANDGSRLLHLHF